MYREYSRYARFTGHGLNDREFMQLMRGDRGEMIRQAADDERREESVVTMKLLHAILWLIQLISVLTDAVLSFLSKDYKGGIYERTKPSIFKEDYDKSGVPVKSRSIKELQQSPILRDKKLWD